MQKINDLFEASISVKKSLIESGQLSILPKMGDAIVDSIQKGGKLMLCGNGGSAADAQHLAAELMVRLRPQNNRQALPAIALAQDTSTITACGNDFGYDSLYERTLCALGREGDILLVITTSGNSENIIRAAHAAKDLNIQVFGFLGDLGGKVAPICDKTLIVPSNDTGRIQESHITAGHALMEYIEDKLLDLGYISLNNTGRN
jgi:D-sedoheptulose 7-phosphate isomerase